MRIRPDRAFFVYLFLMTDLGSPLFLRSILFFILLLLLPKAHTLSAQQTNEQIYQQLLHTFHADNPGPYKALGGRYFSDYLPEIAIDTHQVKSLRFEGYSIQYNPLGKKSYLRSIEIPVSIQGTTLKQEVLTYQDTLDAKGVRRVVKQSLEPFKGEDPTFYSKWIKPASLIGISVLGIVGLFFIRS